MVLAVKEAVGLGWDRLSKTSAMQLAGGHHFWEARLIPQGPTCKYTYPLHLKPNDGHQGTTHRM
jgi:hypothetical protein